MTLAGEPGAAVLTIFDKLVDRIKETRPRRTDGKPLNDFVYSQLILGQMVDPGDYANPWSPMGGSTLQDTVKAADSAPAGNPAPAGTGSTQPTPDPKFRRAMQAAFRTSQLVDTMLKVTKDGSYRQYPTSRHVSFTYENIVNGMQPTPMPPIPPDIQKQIDDARKVLYELDEDGNIIGKSKLYKNYIKNSQAYAKAKSDYADAQAAALADPVKADTWPQNSVFYQQIVDQAWDSFKTEGAEKIERALDIIESVGVSLQDRMIAKARKIYDAWNLGLAGVPEAIPYSYVEPTHWYDPEDDDEGWQKLVIDSKEYHHHADSQTSSDSSSHSESHSSSSGGGGSVGFNFGFFGVDASAEGGSSSTSGSATSTSSGSSQSAFKNDAKDLHIELEYGLCTIHRPWLVTDLFYMKNWYLVNNAKNAISDGTIEGQADKDDQLLPMLPVQFLVIRNLKISTKKWGNDGQTIASIYSTAHNDSSSDSDYVSAGGGFSFGFIRVGGHGAHSSSDSQSNSSSSSSSNWSSDYGWKFDGETLEIKGAQIIAWLSEILPACAPLDDPNLKKDDPKDK